MCFLLRLFFSVVLLWTSPYFGTSLSAAALPPPSTADSSIVAAAADSLPTSRAAALILPADTAALLSVADTTMTDTARVLSRSRFARLSPFWQTAIPVALATIGASAVSDRGFLWKGKSKVREFFGKLRGNSSVRVDDYLQYAPVTWFVWGGCIPGVHHRHNLSDRLLLGATSYAVMGALVNGVKYGVGELRPDGSARNSFPSGHTATAVMGAELVRTEYGNAVGLGAYAGALTVGVLRMYNNRHWINDVLGGAAFGFASVRVALWLLPLEKRWLGIRDKAAPTADRRRRKAPVSPPLIMPTFSFSAAGMTALWVF